MQVHPFTLLLSLNVRGEDYLDENEQNVVPLCKVDGVPVERIEGKVRGSFDKDWSLWQFSNWSEFEIWA